jgi:hypothetical protein
MPPRMTARRRHARRTRWIARIITWSGFCIPCATVTASRPVRGQPYVPGHCSGTFIPTAPARAATRPRTCPCSPISMAFAIPPTGCRISWWLPQWEAYACDHKIRQHQQITPYGLEMNVAVSQYTLFSRSCCLYRQFPALRYPASIASFSLVNETMFAGLILS